MSRLIIFLPFLVIKPGIQIIKMIERVIEYMLIRKLVWQITGGQILGMVILLLIVIVVGWYINQKKNERN